MSEWKIRFGTAGTSDSFTAMGYKNSLDIPAYTEKMGLDAFEYQCGHGVRLGLDKARQLSLQFYHNRLTLRWYVFTGPMFFQCSAEELHLSFHFISHFCAQTPVII